ncbi:hypothetical protein NBRC116583_08770 [Arenicella sp. 4NH20-0111]|uniref:LuxR C-terminal-related transcriptional regulator n=1 Tax=Arenicella sp. 4NH20-0111 TaxID=3127648 RepID=UPI00310A05E4
MENSRFSTLIYRIIGKPDKWHDDYIDIMHQILDETDSFEDPANFSELEVGDQILSRIRGTNDALTAFNTLLNESRFKMIILDEDLSPIYHNQNASELFKEVLDPNSAKDTQTLKPSLKLLVKEATSSIEPAKQSNLMALKAFDQNNDQIYLRSINNRGEGAREGSGFLLLLVLDQGRQQELLNSEFVAQYELTEKEQNVLLKLIHGRNVKEAAAELFVSENTVKTHLKSLFRKTDSKSQADIIRIALTHESQVLDSYFDPSSGLGGIVNSGTEDKFITLKNGLSIAYREYGPANGTPIVVCHNGYGCRMMVPENCDEILHRENKRLIIPDRSGTGLTPFKKGHPESWTECFGEFIDALNLESYEVLGAVMGSVFALLHAVEADDRLKRIHLASPVFVNSRKDMDYLVGIFAPSVRLVRASKRFAREIYELWLKSVTMNLGTHYRSMLDKSLGSEERKLFQANHTLDSTLNLMVNCFKEGASQTIDGISHDMVFCISPRKADLSKVTVPVEIWWGTEDNRISKDGVDNLARQLTNSTVNVREGFSEHIYYGLFEEILSK